MKKRKIIKFFLYLLLTLAITIAFIFSIANSKIFINIEYEEQIMVEEATKIDITTTKGFKEYSADSIHVEIYNKYNKDAQIQVDPTAYDDGSYSLILTPNYTGEYIINVEVVEGTSTYTKSETFVVQ